MKRYIRSSSDQDNTIIIDVVYEHIDSSIVASILPVHFKNGSVSQQGMADYQSFVGTVYNMLCQDFDIVEFYESEDSDTSWYFWLYAKRKDGTIMMKFLIKLRISDHPYGENYKKEFDKTFALNHANEIKKKSGKQRIRLMNIVVNGEEYNSYSEAIDAVADILDEAHTSMTGEHLSSKDESENK